MKFKSIFLSLIIFISPPSWSLQVNDLYTMDATNRTWYLGGIFDANLVQWNNGGKRSNCIEKLGMKGFINKISEFIVALPVDPNSKERKLYDGMNVASLAWLILDKECIR